MRLDELPQRRREVGWAWVRARVAPRLWGGQGGSSCCVTWVGPQRVRPENPFHRKSRFLLHLCAKPDSFRHEELSLSVLSRPPPNPSKYVSFVSQAENGSQSARFWDWRHWRAASWWL